MHDKVTVLGIIDADMHRVIDMDYSSSEVAWMTLVCPETGSTHRLEGRGRKISTLLELIADRVLKEEAEFISANGAIVLVGFP